MGYPYWAMLALPYSRLELPGWGKLLVLAGVYKDHRWRAAPMRVIRGKLHGYLMRLNLSGWSERQTYFLGRYYDLQTQLFVMAALRPGETFIDVGGNIGMITLLGARLVGDAGRVVTFEPNPDAARRIQEALEDNCIRNVTLHRKAVSDQPGTLVLSVITEHTGMGTLAAVETRDESLVTARHNVDVVQGDSVLPADLPGPMTIKMDIEGFECRAVRGLLQTIRKHRPVIVTEVVGHHLKRAGHSVRELCDLMHGEGYAGYVMNLKRRWLRQNLVLRRMDKPDETMDHDVAWICPGSTHEKRLAPYIEA